MSNDVLRFAPAAQGDDLVLSLALAHPAPLRDGVWPDGRSDRVARDAAWAAAPLAFVIAAPFAAIWWRRPQFAREAGIQLLPFRIMPPSHAAR
ncbi:MULTISPECIES: hypothetical protein [unclassified Bradyrhizobium]|uniref:hypothetical protein n=1 Tax=unclassified Bradyrhizobium TaxID=2631580 RepID=UPI0028F01262|nr:MULTISPECIES: hypothetical protein [unclassified Bradyrhizobium]